MNFFPNLCLESDSKNNYEHHVPGNIVMYRGKDGIKYYVILSREDITQPNTTYGTYKYVKLVTAMIANPLLQINERIQKREFNASCVSVMNVNNWIQIQSEFLTEMTDMAAKRLSTYQIDNK